MGKYAISQEIEYTKHHRFPFYYLGYYIHSCPKMSYKSQYKPSEILCPITKQWVDVNQAMEMIDRRSPNHNYCNLTPNDSDDDLAATNESTTTSPITFKTQSEKDEDESQTSFANDMENQIALQVGYEKPISLAMLNGPAKDLVRPIIHDFVRHMGNDIDLAQKFIIDLVS
jgi:Arginine-tRNA-protein transferase, C terminus